MNKELFEFIKNTVDKIGDNYIVSLSNDNKAIKIIGGEMDKEDWIDVSVRLINALCDENWTWYGYNLIDVNNFGFLLEIESES